jgi:ADP-ribosylglycohydrolase
MPGASRGRAWRDALDRRPWGAYSWVHTVNNACLVAAALLWGGGDFTRSVSLAVRGGWDTDCNGATVGSVVGAMQGRGAIGERWSAPLRDELRSALFGFERSSIVDLAVRTVRVARRTLETGGRAWEA